MSLWEPTKAVFFLPEAGVEVHRAGSWGRKDGCKVEEMKPSHCLCPCLSGTSPALYHGPNHTPGREWEELKEDPGGSFTGPAPAPGRQGELPGDREAAAHLHPPHLLQEPCLWLVMAGNIQGRQFWKVWLP